MECIYSICLLVTIDSIILYEQWKAGCGFKNGSGSGSGSSAFASAFANDDIEEFGNNEARKDYEKFVLRVNYKYIPKFFKGDFTVGQQTCLMMISSKTWKNLGKQLSRKPDTIYWKITVETFAILLLLMSSNHLQKMKVISILTW